MRTEENNNTHEKFEKIPLKDIRWCSATCDCIKNDWMFLSNFRTNRLNVFDTEKHLGVDNLDEFINNTSFY